MRMGGHAEVAPPLPHVSPWGLASQGAHWIWRRCPTLRFACRGDMRRGPCAAPVHKVEGDHLPLWKGGEGHGNGRGTATTQNGVHSPLFSPLPLPLQY